MSKAALAVCALLYFITALTSSGPYELRACFFLYGVSNLILVRLA